MLDFPGRLTRPVQAVLRVGKRKADHLAFSNSIFFMFDSLIGNAGCAGVASKGVFWQETNLVLMTITESVMGKYEG